MSRTLHIMAGLGPKNGIANAARRFACEQSERGDEPRLLAPSRKWNPAYFDFAFAVRAWRAVRTADEVWVHGSWTFPVWFGAWAAKLLGRRLVAVPSGSHDPMRLCNASAWKKRLVAPLDRRVLRRADEVLALCREEADWIRAFEPSARVRVAQVPTFFGRGGAPVADAASVRLLAAGRPLRVLFLGRADDSLKGVRFLEAAVARLNGADAADDADAADASAARPGANGVELRVVSDAVGAEKESAWQWCDVLCLPTLSENFGLVVAEALERGKPVVTTDGAPAWREHFRRHPESGAYLEGFRDGDDSSRVKALSEAIARIAGFGPPRIARDGLGKKGEARE